jgi:hypothetical protein
MQSIQSYEATSAIFPTCKSDTFDLISNTYQLSTMITQAINWIEFKRRRPFGNRGRGTRSQIMEYYIQVVNWKKLLVKDS